jgi:hypothetical protein
MTLSHQNKSIFFFFWESIENCKISILADVMQITLGYETTALEAYTTTWYIFRMYRLIRLVDQECSNLEKALAKCGIQYKDCMINNFQVYTQNMAL